MDIQEIMDTIPLAFWKSLAFQQIAKREDLELPKWSILVNDTGVQVSLFWQSSTATASEEASAATFVNGTNHVSGSSAAQLLTAQKSELLERIQRIKDENEIALPTSDSISPPLHTLLQAAMQKGLLAPNSTLSLIEPNNTITSSSPVDETMTNPKLQDVLKQINMSTSQALGEKPAKIRRKSTPIKNLALNTSSLQPASMGNQASKRLVEIKNHHLSDQNGPFGATLASMAAAMGGSVELNDNVETIDTSLCVKQEDEGDGMDQIERIAAKTGTLQTLQKMRTEAQRGTLNLSKAVRLLARCLFNEDELVVESIKDLDQHKVDLLHAETTKWYNCTMTEVRQVMSFRLSEIRKTKRASHWGKRAPQQSNGNTTLMLGLSTMLNEPYILPKPTDIVPKQSKSSPNSST